MKTKNFILIFAVILITGIGLGILASNFGLIKNDTWFLTLGIPALIAALSFSLKTAFEFFIKYQREKEDGEREKQNILANMYLEALMEFFGNSKADKMTKGIINLMIKGDDDVAKSTIQFIRKANQGVKKVKDQTDLFELLYTIRKKHFPETQLKREDLEI